MRTTVTIDADTEALLKEEVGRTGLPFKEVLNRAVRKALATSLEGPKPRVTPIFSEAFPPGLGEAGFNRLADSLDDDETLNELGR